MGTAPKRFRWGFLVVGAVLVGMIAWLVYGNKKPARANASPIVAVTTTGKSRTAALVVVTDTVGEGLVRAGFLLP